MVLNRFHLSNHLGSSNLELDYSAVLICYEEYNPFGSTSYQSGRNQAETSLKRFRYVGKERDDETGLYYYGARYYASWLCRFVSVDPLKDEYPYYTPYQYAGNKPVVATDKQGKQEDPVVNNFPAKKLPKDRVPNKLPDNLSEYFLTERQDLIEDFTTAFSEGSTKEQKREFINTLQSDFKDYVLDQTKISKQDGRYKFDDDLSAEESRGLIEQGVSVDVVRNVKARRKDLANQALESTSINSLVFERQKQNDVTAAKYQLLKLQRELEKLQEIQEAGFDLGDLGTILGYLGDAVEVTGYILIATGVGGGAGAALVITGKGVSLAGSALTVSDALEEGNYTAIAIEGTGFLISRTGSRLIDKGFKARELTKLDRALFEGKTKILSKETQYLLNQISKDN